MDMKMVIATSAAAFIAVAAVAQLVDLNRPVEMTAIAIRGSVEPQHFDRLSEVLIQCAEKGEAGSRDPDCLRAWAANRRRFLGGGTRWHDDAASAPDRAGAIIAKPVLPTTGSQTAQPVPGVTTPTSGPTNEPPIPAPANPVPTMAAPSTPAEAR